MYNYLCSIIHLKETKKKGIFISKSCPFTGYISKNRIFKYNSILKVCKCYCCGGSAKELYWLKLQIENNIEFKIKKLKTDKFIKIVFKDKSIDYISSRIKEIKNKAIEQDGVIVKSTDFNFPF